MRRKSAAASRLKRRNRGLGSKSEEAHRHRAAVLSQLAAWELTGRGLHGLTTASHRALGAAQLVVPSETQPGAWRASPPRDQDS
eukprot:scaffold74114_cov60-Phaeocystis_antarctica.AAC.1